VSERKVSFDRELGNNRIFAGTRKGEQSTVPSSKFSSSISESVARDGIRRLKIRSREGKKWESW
jgi:hypothetical protein